MAVDSQALARQDDQRGIATADREQAAGALAHILGTGDLSQLTNEQRVAYYLDVCQSLDLNPRTRPFDWIEFYDPTTKAKKLALYPNKSCAEQLRRQHQISVRVTRREPIGDLFVCEVEGTTPNGRVGQASKYVSVTDSQGNRLRGQALANAYAKAETGAMRRLAFSMVGMASPPDMDELQRARVVVVDGTGTVLSNPTPEQKALADNPDLARIIKEPVYEDMSADQSLLSGVPDQRVTPDELERPEPPTGPRPSFRASEEDVRRWCGAWFGIVDDTPWDTKEARAQVVLQWTSGDAGWPESKVTDSLRAMFARSTEAEAADFLARTRAMVSAWRDGQSDTPIFGQNDAQSAEVAASETVRKARGEAPRGYDVLFPDDMPPEGPPKMTPEGHAAATLTGAPAAPASTSGQEPARPAADRDYSRQELRAMYAAWAVEMQKADVMFRPENVQRLPDGALRSAVDRLIQEYDAIVGDIFGDRAEPEDVAEGPSVALEADGPDGAAF